MFKWWYMFISKRCRFVICINIKFKLKILKLYKKYNFLRFVHVSKVVQAEIVSLVRLDVVQ